jgi:hypothetical protein
MKHKDYDSKVASIMAGLPPKSEVTPVNHNEPVKKEPKTWALIVVFTVMAALLGYAIWQLSLPPEIISSTFDY